MPSNEIDASTAQPAAKSYLVSPLALLEIQDALHAMIGCLGVAYADAYFEEKDRWPEELNHLGRLMGDIDAPILQYNNCIKNGTLPTLVTIGEPLLQEIEQAVEIGNAILKSKKSLEANTAQQNYASYATDIDYVIEQTRTWLDGFKQIDLMQRTVEKLILQKHTDPESKGSPLMRAYNDAHWSLLCTSSSTPLAFSLQTKPLPEALTSLKASFEAAKDDRFSPKEAAFIEKCLRAAHKAAVAYHSAVKTPAR